MVKIFRMINREIFKNQYLKKMLMSMGQLFTGQIIIRVSNICYGIILARILGKENFGFLSIVFVIVTLFSQIAGAGLGVTATRHIALLKNSDPKRTGDCLSFCVLVSGSFAIMVAFMCVLSSEMIAVRLYHQIELINIVNLSSIFLFSSVFVKTLEGVLSGLEEFSTIITGNIIQVCVLLIVGIILSYKFSTSGAVLALGISWSANCLFSIYKIYNFCIRDGIILSLAGAFKERRIFWKYSIPNILTSIVVGPSIAMSNAIVANIPGGVGGLGSYHAAMSWRRAVLFAPQAVRRVTLPFLAKTRGENDRKAFKKVLIFNLAINGGVACVIATIVSICAPIIMLFYGEEFREDYVLVIILAISGVFQAINDVITQVGAALEKMWWNFVIHLIWAISLYVLSKNFVTFWGVYGYAIAFATVTFNHMLLNSLSALYFLKKENFT